jgi:hypothetical protein
MARIYTRSRCYIRRTGILIKITITKRRVLLCSILNIDAAHGMRGSSRAGRPSRLGEMGATKGSSDFGRSSICVLFVGACPF